MVSLIDLKPVRRCGRCSHLIPKEQTSCPYCNGNVSTFQTTEKDIRHSQPATPSKPMSPETKKRLVIGGIVAATVIIVLVVFNMVQGMFRLDKSIYEPLDKSDITALEKDDPQFAEFYEQCTLIRQTMSAAEYQQKYGSITYKQLREYLNHYGNKAYSDEVIAEEKKHYTDDVYAPVKPKVDALIAKWNKFVEDNDVNKYLQIDIKCSKGNRTILWETEAAPAFYFVCKMPKGKLKDCSVTLSVKEKESGMNAYGTSDTPVDLNTLLQWNSSDNIGVWNTSWYDGFWNYNEMQATINSVTLSNGKVIKADALSEVPESVKTYLENKNSDTEFAMIKDQIDKSYPSENEFALDKLTKKLESLDPLCYELLNKVAAATGRPMSLSSSMGGF